MPITEMAPPKTTHQQAMTAATLAFKHAPENAITGVRNSNHRSGAQGYENLHYSRNHAAAPHFRLRLVDPNQLKTERPSVASAQFYKPEPRLLEVNSTGPPSNGQNICWDPSIPQANSPSDLLISTNVVERAPRKSSGQEHPDVGSTIDRTTRLSVHKRSAADHDRNASDDGIRPSFPPPVIPPSAVSTKPVLFEKHGNLPLLSGSDQQRAIALARDIYLQQLYQERQNNYASNFSKPAANREHRAFKKSVRSSSNVTQDTVTPSAKGEEQIKKNRLVTKARNISRSIKIKVKQLFRRRSGEQVMETEHTVEEHPVEITHCSDDGVTSDIQLDKHPARHSPPVEITNDCDGGVTSSIELDEDPARQVPHLPSLQLARPIPQISSGVRPASVPLDDNGLGANDKSRVTSWADSTAQNTMASHYGNEANRMSIIPELTDRNQFEDDCAAITAHTRSVYAALMERIQEQEIRNQQQPKRIFGTLTAGMVPVVPTRRSSLASNNTKRTIRIVPQKENERPVTPCKGRSRPRQVLPPLIDDQEEDLMTFTPKVSQSKPNEVFRAPTPETPTAESPLTTAERLAEERRLAAASAAGVPEHKYHPVTTDWWW
ncbi:MAG: hypothetical protein M1833_002946 [Piccolia ochrophora]|nr:MAG: hypothetical protein M1833_002946 [Piccolia ochrophora]